MIINNTFAVSTLAALFIGSASVLADTGKLVNPNNNHIYQRFDTTQRTWDSARTACIALGAHLATITSLQENNWIWGNIGGSDTTMWLGGTNEVQKGIWTWITGEPWAYINWEGDNEPSSPNYLVMRNYNGLWRSVGGPNNPLQTASYICEWEAVQYLSMNPIPNITKGKPTNYALIGLNGGTYTLYLVDGSTGKKITSTNVGSASNITFKSLSVMDDFDGNGIKDIAVMINKPANPSVMMVFSGSNVKLLNTINLPTK
jgi:Lectin C-type domain